MPLTIGDCITEARRILQDTVTPYRWTDDDLYDALNLALSEARRMRPDLFLADLFATTATVYTAADAATAFPIWDAYMVAIVAFVVGWASLRDDQFADDGRSLKFLATLKAQLGAG